MADTPGKRLYLIRLALGDGVKNPMIIEDFVALVKKKRRVNYQESAISRAENGGRKLSIQDVEHFAGVDPLKRGASWLAFGEQTEATKLTTDDRTRARAEVARADAEAEKRDRRNDRGSGS